MRNSLFVIVACISMQQAVSQASVAWNQPVGGSAIALDAQNNVFTAIGVYNPGGDITVTKYSTTGMLLWQATYDNTDNTRHELATSVVADSRGNVLVCGTIRSGYSSPVNAASVLMKYDAAGNLQWRRVYENSFDGSYTRRCLTDAADNIYVLGMGSGPNGFVTKVKKFSPDGNALWTYYDAAGIGIAQWMKWTPDGALLLIGRSQYGSYNGYAKINTQGSPLWSLAGVASLTAGDAAGDAAGNTYVVHGEYVSNGGTVIKKLNPTGVQQWQRVYNLSAFRVEVGSDGFPVACGFPNTGSAGVSVIKTDAAGSLIWANSDADGAYNLLSHAQLVLDAANNAYLAAGTMQEMAVCKVNSNGTSAWTLTAPFGYAQSMAVGNDNAVYVTGGTTVKMVQYGILPCNMPAGLNSSAIGATTATLAWQTSNGAVGYNLRYKPASSATWTNMSTSANSANLLSLQPATTYEWQVQAVCSDANSTFTASALFVTATNCTDSYEPNNSLAAAKTISAGTVVKGTIANATDADWFKVTTLKPNTNLRLNLSNLPADFDMSLHNTKGNLLATSANSGITSESISYNSKTAATWYIKVYGKNGTYAIDRCYDLLVTVSSSAIAGKTEAAYANAKTGPIMLRLYPNPAREVLNVALPPRNGPATLQVTSADGRLAGTAIIPPGTQLFKLPLAGYSPGLYMLQCKTAQGAVQHTFIVVPY